MRISILNVKNCSSNNFFPCYPPQTLIVNSCTTTATTRPGSYCEDGATRVFAIRDQSQQNTEF